MQILSIPPGNNLGLTLFPQKFKLQYEHQMFKEFVDLDHPYNLQDRNSNRLLVVDVEDDDNEADKSASIRIITSMKFVILKLRENKLKAAALNRSQSFSVILIVIHASHISREDLI